MTDWDDLRYFLAVARTGSLSGAARALGVAQPTVGRRLDAFEQRLGSRLFDRGPRGLVPTPVGIALRPRAERMEVEALGAERETVGRDDGLSGRVRVTGSEWLCVRVLAPALAPLLERNAQLGLELLADARHLDLARREADLAVRPSRFTRASVYQRRIGRIGFALYASPAYIVRHGEDLGRRGAGHTIIILGEEIGDVARTWIATHASDARIVARTNGREPMATLAAAGAGLACLPHLVGDSTTGLVRVAAPALPTAALWLGVHRDMRAVPRVRATIAALAAEVPLRAT